MKTLKILFIALLCAVSSFADVQTFRSSYFCRRLVERPTFGGYVKNSTKIIIDTDCNYIVIYTADPQQYKFIGKPQVYYDKDGDKTMKVLCQDRSGKQVNVRVIKRPDASGKECYQLLINYTDVTLCYTMYPVK